MEIIHSTDSNFNDLISKELVLVDFFATWCGPCKMLGPVLEEIKDQIQIIKVDVDECENVSREYGIMSVPTLLLINNGKILSTRQGYLPKEQLLDWIEENK